MLVHSVNPLNSVIQRKWKAIATRFLSVTLIASLMFTLVATWNAPVVAMETASLATASAVPVGAQFYLAVDVNPASEQFTKSLELLERVGLADTEDSLTSIVSPGVGVSGANIETVDDLVDGEIAVAGTRLNFDELGAFSDFSMDGDFSDIDVDELVSNVSSGIGIVISASNMADVIVELEAEFREDAAIAGLPVGETEAEGARILVVAADETTGETGNVMAIIDDVVILGTVVEDVRPFIEAKAGVVPSLASDSDFIKTMAQLPADTLIAMYSPAPTDLDSIEDLLGEAGVSLALDLLIGPGAASGLAVSADDAGFRVNTVQLASPGEKFEAAGVASGLTLAGRVPSDSLLLVNGFDLGSSLSFRLIEQLLVVATGIMSGVSETAPEMSSAYIDSQLASFAPLLGFNPQTDFIQQLEGEFGFAVTQVDPVDPANIQAIITSEVGDPLVVADALGSLGALIQAGSEGQAVVSTVTIGDAAVNQIAITSDTGDINVQYGVVGDEFALAIGDALVEYALGSGEPLSENVDFQETMALLPTEYDGLFYLGVSELASAGEPMLEGVSSSLDAGLQDSSARCAEFLTQSEAQAAYDEDPIANFDLDLDFDGVACSDFVGQSATGSPEPVLNAEVGVGSFAAVSYKQDGMAFTSGILVIPGEE